MQIDLHIDVQIDDYLALLSFVRDRSRKASSQSPNPWLRRSMIFIVSFFIGIGIFSVVKIFGCEIHLPSAIGAAVVTFAIVVSVIYWQLKQFQNYTLPQPGGSVLGNHHYQIRDDAIHIDSSYGTIRLVWTAVKSLEEAPNHFFLFIDRSAAFILPKRSFAEESVKAQFKAKVAERCGKPA